MDYEKAYKDALERAKYYHDRDNIQFLENIFPELAESEDERIRKAIVEFFELQDDNTTYSFIPKKDILAWLEKQGKQKPAWGEEDEKMIDNIIDYMKPMPIFFESTKGASGKEYTQKFVKNATNWLKSLKERIGGRE